MTIEHYRTNSIEECNAAIPELLSKAIYIPNARKYLFLDHSHLVDILCYGDDTYLITADGDNYAQLLQDITKLQLDGKPATDAKGAEKIWGRAYQPVKVVKGPEAPAMTPEMAAKIAAAKAKAAAAKAAAEAGNNANEEPKAV